MAAHIFRLGIDLMGADVSPVSIFEAVLKLPPDFYAQTSIVLFATEPIVKELQGTVFNNKIFDSLTFQTCAEVIKMSEISTRAVRRKKESTLVRSVLELKEGTIDALVSCASTGALVTASYLHLGTFPHLSRPALLTLFPSKKGPVVVLDVGAILSYTACQLAQLAFLGAVYARSLFGISLPTVALLNIGTESEKGNQALKEGWDLLSHFSKKLPKKQEMPFLFVGNKEPRDLFAGDANVFVSSGFSGNIFLKTAEGTAAFVLDLLKEKMTSFSGLSEIEEKLFSDQQQGAIVFGVQGLVIKCHGSATQEAIIASIIHAGKLFERKLLARAQDFLKQYQEFIPS